MKNRSHIILVILYLIALTACDNRPKGILSENKMVDILTDMAIAEAYSRAELVGSGDSVKYMLGESVFLKHNVTKAQVDSTLSWYGRNMDLYEELYNKVIKELTRRQRALAGMSDEQTGNDLWPFINHSIITENGTSNSLSFSISSGDINPGEKLIWYLHSPQPINIQGLLGVDYSNGETAYTVRTIASMRQVDFSLQTDTSKTVKRIFGTINSSSKTNLPLWLDSISLIVHPYDSTEYYKVSMQRHYYGPKKRIKVKYTEDGDSTSHNVNVLPGMSENQERKAMENGKVDSRTMQKFSEVER